MAGRLQHVVLSCALLAGCGDAHRSVGGAEFVALMQRPVSSTSHVTFVGTCGLRAYAEYWRMGIGETRDVYSVAIDELPAAERAALREGRNPWARALGPGETGLRAQEREALQEVLRLPPSVPQVVVVRCAGGQPARAARVGFDTTFTDDDVLPVPAPADVVLVVTADEDATLHDGERGTPLHAGAAGTSWRRLDGPGPAEVTVKGATTTWRVQLRCVPAAEFHAPAFDQRRTKR